MTTETNPDETNPEATAPDDLIRFNGIDADTGGPYIPPQKLEALVVQALRDVLDAESLENVRARLSVGASFAPSPDADPRDLAQVGWGYVAAFDEDPAVLAALEPLFALRRAQAGQRFFAWVKGQGYRPNDSKFAFLKRLNVYLGGFVDARKAPYYLLVVGSPEKVPYRFQFDMDVEFAVGRLHFDTPDEYRRYAESVVAAEAGVRRPRVITMLGVQNKNDPNTADSMAHLVTPLTYTLKARQAELGWTVREVPPVEATKPKLAALLGGADAPAVLFTASHGMNFKLGDPNQREHGGALVSQEFVYYTKPTPAVYFTGADLSASANVHGMINFHFACHSAGTPKLNDYAMEGTPPQLAPAPFVARLPQRLLAHPNGGALAVVGHVNTAIGDSYRFTGSAGEQLVVYEAVFDQLLRGFPIGWAMEGFGARYGNVTVALSELQETVKYGGDPVALGVDIGRLWAAKVDTRAFTILGDPAVRPAVAPA